MGSDAMEKITNEVWQLKIDNYVRLEPRVDVRFGFSGRQAYEVNHDINAPSRGASNPTNDQDRLLPGQQIKVWSAYGEGAYRPIATVSLIAGLRLERTFPCRVAVLHAAEAPETVHREGGCQYNPLSVPPRPARSGLRTERQRWQTASE
jgi:hypothetical protein